MSRPIGESSENGSQQNGRTDLSSKLSGMTGFGRSAGEADWGTWVWEAKSVNGRGLDVRVNVPNGLEVLERAAKTFAAERLQRGNLQVSLRVELTNASEMGLNERALDVLITHFQARTGAVPDGVALATLMTSRPVQEASGSSSDTLRAMGQDEATLSELTASLTAAMEELAAARLAEGAAVADVLSGLLDHMTDLLADASALADTHPQLLKDRLTARLQDLGAEDAVDADRLAVEAALSAAKADVREELDRLAAHIETGWVHLAAGSPIGRKLDFLAQEMNREANTLCAKSISIDLTNAGLGLKAVIDQFKEQAANVE